MGHIDDRERHRLVTVGCNCPYCTYSAANYLGVFTNYKGPPWYSVAGKHKFTNATDLPDGVIHLSLKPTGLWSQVKANDPYGYRPAQYIDEFDFVLAGCWAIHLPIVYLRKLDVLNEAPDFWVKHISGSPPLVYSSSCMEVERERRLAQLYPKDFPQLAAQYTVKPYTPVPVPSLIPNAKASPKTGFSGVQIEGENGKVIMAPPPRTGYACQKCQSFNEYAASNAPGDAYICYNCRVVL